MALFVSVGFMNSYGVYQEYYQKHQLRSHSAFDISWIGAFATFMLGVGAAPAGLLVDKIGPNILVCGGGVGVVLGAFMTSLCKEYYQFFLAQGLLMGLSMSFLVIPYVLVGRLP
jgi:MFS family permease